MTSPLALAQRLGDGWKAAVRARRPGWLTDDVVAGVRWGLIASWVLLFGYQLFGRDGIPWLRSDLLLWLAGLLLACSVGRRSVLTVFVDFLPLALVLIAYDYLRGFADTMGMPTWWHPQADVDRWLFLDHSPTVFLQEHLKHPDPRWYDVVVALTYFSFFFLPYVTAAVLWLRSRASFYRWSLRFVALSFVGFTCFALFPAAPPWAAALCSPSDVAGHPHAPACMARPAGPVPGNLLGSFTTAQDGAHPWVERISTRGFEELHLRFASTVIRAGQVSADNVAAVPSLHFGGTLLFVLFLWGRVRRGWRPLLVAYPVVMAFSLVYSGEHYLSDCLAGAAVATAVHLTGRRIERRREDRTPPDTLGAGQAAAPPPQEPVCPPSISPAPRSATMPSST